MKPHAQSPENPLAQEFNIKSLLKFAFPTVVMMIFMGLYTIVDTIFVARFVNTDALSAINIVCPVINLIVGLGTMLATGGSAMIARKMGAGEEKRASQDFTFIVLTGTIIGLLIAVTGTLFIDPLLGRLGASGLLFPYCKEYLLVVILFTPASMLQVLFQNLIVTAGRPGFGMVLSVSAGVANLFLDYLFMVPLQMGIRGAALGTGIGYLIPALTGIYFFAGNHGSLKFRMPKIDISVLTESCFNGFSEMVSQMATAVTTLFFNMIMLRLLGESGVAAITIMIYTGFLLSTLYIGFSMGVAPVISYHYGLGDHQRLKKVFKICIFFIIMVSVIVFALSMIFGSALVGIFSKKGTSVYDIARDGFWIFPFSFLFSGINIFVSAFFTALSNGKASALISSLRTFVFLACFLLTLPFFFQETGVWLAVPLSELITVFASVALLVKNRNRYQYL
ncbi:MAG: MATE family efflux transporter [Lachnospiraceae bacterium]|nr:MATE family efflux transporter [Lachnospiraceae bacterium]